MQELAKRCSIRSSDGAAAGRNFASAFAVLYFPPLTVLEAPWPPLGSDEEDRSVGRARFGEEP